MPVGSCTADRLRICGTRITATKQGPISQSAPGLAARPRRCGIRITETKREPIRGWPLSFPKTAKLSQFHKSTLGSLVGAYSSVFL
jgi:hypothetical protein